MVEKINHPHPSLKKEGGIEKSVLSLGEIGRVRFSGTVASGLTVGVLWLMREGVMKWWWLMPVKSIVLTIAGAWLIKRVMSNKFDQKWIVVDEVAGVVMAATAWGMVGIANWQMVGATFLLFRLFDGWKPSIIGKIDKWDSPWGVMLDDVAAGGITAMIVILGAKLFGY